MTEPLVVQPNCQDGGDPALTLNSAVSTVEQSVAALAGCEVLALRDALGRVLATPAISPADVPPHRNSAMDGYALAGDDLPVEGTADLPVVGTAWAGRPYTGPLGRGECVRIMTGAKMPDVADTVVIQEQAQLVGEDRVRIGAGHKRGQNVRHPGEDITRGSEVLGRGKRLGPPELGVLASLGLGEVTVFRQPRVAFFSSGDELRSIGQTLDEGQIYDSNRYTIYGMLREAGVQILDLGVVPDHPEDLERALDAAARDVDLVLSTGGISVGAADHLRTLIGERGELLFSKVEMKPGRPVTFGRWGRAWYFGLPGNPVAAMVTFYLLVRPALRRLRGEEAEPEVCFSAIAEAPLRKLPGRTEVQRGILFPGTDGSAQVRRSGRQGSGVLTSVTRANCFILLEHERGEVRAGEQIRVLPFERLRW